MLKSNKRFLLTFISLVALAGCATGRNYQSDIDALNSKVTAMQGQLSEKDQEIMKLQNQLSQQQASLDRSEDENRMLSEKLDNAMRAKSESKGQPQSDLK